MSQMRKITACKSSPQFTPSSSEGKSGPKVSRSAEYQARFTLMPAVIESEWTGGYNVRYESERTNKYSVVWREFKIDGALVRACASRACV